MKNIEEGLKILGLNKKEIKIILVLHVESFFSVTKLSKMTKIPRTTLLPILHKLQQRGFVNQTKIKNHKEWCIVPVNIFREKLQKVLTIFDEK